MRIRQFDAVDATECATRFDKLIDDSFNIIIPTEADFENCWNLLSRFGNNLMAGDALHLAIAANHTNTLYTLDNGLLDAGRLLNLSVDRGNYLIAIRFEKSGRSGCRFR
ncbi:MAG: type II toxin-antitoxin system VapC family toxin [Sedimenticola sp.]